MDEEYAKQVRDLMGWEAQVKMPQTTTDPTGKTANNPGYCLLTFPSPQHAATVLAQLNSSQSGTQTMPNSNKPFVVNWASSPIPSPATPSYLPPTPTSANSANQSQKEYSIFVGDLAPETSNSDLVAVFKNPVLGLRNDRAPKFIRPFASCKSAKIMLDPVTGVSRGYGFVRFTDEADQQRALIEMHGLYCLSRPSEYLLYVFSRLFANGYQCGSHQRLRSSRRNRMVPMLLLLLALTALSLTPQHAYSMAEAGIRPLRRLAQAPPSVVRVPFPHFLPQALLVQCRMVVRTGFPALKLLLS